jgi:two-component system response regulator (stage 0 sporulation protein F)
MKNLLIVDDQFGIRIMLNETLQRDGYKTFQAAKGVQALDILGENDIDLLLLDMKLPGMDGIELLGRAIANGYSKHVITMSAYQEKDFYTKSKGFRCKKAFS